MSDRQMFHYAYDTAMFAVYCADFMSQDGKYDKLYLPLEVKRSMPNHFEAIVSSTRHRQPDNQQHNCSPAPPGEYNVGVDSVQRISGNRFAVQFKVNPSCPRQYDYHQAVADALSISREEAKTLNHVRNYSAPYGISAIETGLRMHEQAEQDLWRKNVDEKLDILFRAVEKLIKFIPKRKRAKRK